MEKIKDYWNTRAATDKANATTNDVWLRDLERATLVEHLGKLGCGKGSKVLDAGCGDGETPLEIASQLGCETFGVDYSSSMIDLAREKQAERGIGNVSFSVGDVRELGKIFAAGSLDFVTTDRCLINLESSEEQYQAIAGIAALLKTGGTYLAIENFVEGNDRLNELRSAFDLPPIEIRWHNRFFNTAEFVARVTPLFSRVETIDFSSAYYFATRVIYSKLCAVDGKQPDYRHPIHELSTKLPIVGDYSPIKLVLLTK